MIAPGGHHRRLAPPRATAVLMGAARSGRRNWLFTSLLATGLVLRAMTQFAYRPALVYIDSDRYLRALGGQDPLGYRVWLWPLQRAGGLAAVAAGQHALGLGMAMTLYIVLRHRGLWRWLAALAAAPVLVDAYQLQAEQTIMPDVLFEALIVAGMACVLWRGRPAVRLACTAGVLFGMAVDVRQAGEALLLPVLLLMVVCGPGWRRRLACGVLAGASFAAPVLGYMTGQYAATGHFAITQRGAGMLYARAAIAADCATLRMAPDERGLCPPPQAVATMGIDGILGDDGGPLSIYRPPRGTTTRAMAGRFAVAVLRQQPWAVIGSVDHDFLRLFALTRDGSPGATPISRWQFQLTYPTYPPVITLRYVARLQPGSGPPEAARPLAEILRAYQLHGGFTPGPLLALALIAGLAGCCARGGLPGPHRGLAGSSIVCTGAAVALLLASDAYEFSWRYQLPALVLLPIAGALGTATISARFRAERSADAIHDQGGAEMGNSRAPKSARSTAQGRDCLPGSQ